MEGGPGSAGDGGRWPHHQVYHLFSTQLVDEADDGECKLVMIRKTAPQIGQMISLLLFHATSSQDET